MTEDLPAGSVALLVFPYYPDNPWQDIVYRRFIEDGGTVTMLDDLSDLRGAADAAREAGRWAVLHMNWTTPVSQAAVDVIDSMDRVTSALATVDEFLADGGRLAWSIHNALPHETRFLLPELVLCRGLAARAQRVITMNPATRDAVAPMYPIAADRCVQIDFPSYIGLYPDEADRNAARRRFGISDEEILSVFVGVLRPYKGLESLLFAFDILWGSDPRHRLLIGGKPGPGYTSEDLERIFHSRPYLQFHGGHVPDEDLQWWMAASDVVVLPYLRGLNVSVVQLAATFGRPVALRRLPEFAYLQSEEWVRWIHGEGVELADTLGRAASEMHDHPEISAEATRYASARSPEVISARYRDLFVGLAGGR